MAKITSVYIIINKINNKFYLGSSINTKRRFREHKSDLRRGIHGNEYLQKSWNKYGEENFIFKIYEQYIGISEDGLRQREQLLINLINPDYNLSDNVYCPIKTPEQIEATSIKMRKKFIVTSPEGKEFVVDNLTKFCGENNLTLCSMRSVASGRTGQHKNWLCRKLEDKEQLFKRKRIFSYIILSPDEKEYETKNLTEFCKEHNLSQSHMQEVLYGKNYHHKGWRVRFSGKEFKKIKPRLVIDWVLINPDGDTIETKNLKQFCKDNNLDDSALIKVSKGKMPHYRNWICYKKKDGKPEFISKKGREFFILSPSNKEYKIRNLKKFCREHGLVSQCMYCVAEGKNSHHKGWKCRFAEDKDFKYKDRCKKEWIITNLKGEEITIKNLAKFCRENDLEKGGMQIVAYGKASHYKGWKCRFAQDKEQKYTSNQGKRYEITYPDGKKENIKNLTKFCETNNINMSALCSVAAGKLKKYKGFECRKLDDKD